VKAKHVQDYGGIFMIVADNVPTEDPNRLVMADDGKGSTVTIPSFLISNKDGIKLKEEIHSMTNDEIKKI